MIEHPAHAELTAHAKLTLSLRITGVRDDGYHLVDAEMVTLDLTDTVTIETRTIETGTIEMRTIEARTRTDLASTVTTASGPYADGVPLDADNLVVRALHLTGSPPAAVHLHKRIPHGGGLGGGSADAAAILRWAGWSGTPDELATAARLGADIAFCLVGGRARVRGIGEVVEPLPHLDRIVTLVIPPVRVSTPAAYRAWDDLGGPTAPGPNDLEPAALAIAPELARWRDRIGDATGRSPVLAGSGATWFVHGEHSSALVALGNEGAEIIAARTVPAEAQPRR
ncbi:MAG TPA: 4-(cytidine 5'-diphospho)-2-C-methyl-D-erythritol kinase [Ilumatobacter sp.]|nr:4-(cytidine 5'-diphospho)-2-C-methyl-D-erythritol kinase [Ilumatobacter sp.]